MGTSTNKNGSKLSSKITDIVHLDYNKNSTNFNYLIKYCRQIKYRNKCFYFIILCLGPFFLQIFNFQVKL